MTTALSAEQIAALVGAGIGPPHGGVGGAGETLAIGDLVTTVIRLRATLRAIRDMAQESWSSKEYFQSNPPKHVALYRVWQTAVEELGEYGELGR